MSALDDLRRDPFRTDFFELVRRVECENPARPRIGEAKRPSDEPVRFGQTASAAFAPSSLAGVRAGKKGHHDWVQVHFFGMLGTDGPLPLHLTEYVRDRLRNSGDPTMARFLDMFHHRMLSLFYRAWAAKEPAVEADRPATDRFATWVGSLFGLGFEPLRRRDAMPDRLKLHHAGRLATPRRNAEGLRAILEDFFDLPFRVRSFVGHWLRIPEGDVWRLGRSAATGSLGRNANLGARVWECQQKFRIVAGPLGLEDYARLLPGSRALERVAAVVRNYVGDEFAWDVELVLDRNEVPPLRLGGSERLGWTSWLTSRTPDRDPRDLVVEAAARPE